MVDMNLGMKGWDRIRKWSVPGRASATYAHAVVTQGEARGVREPGGTINICRAF
jgi:hypothetical protein